MSPDIPRSTLALVLLSTLLVGLLASAGLLAWDADDDGMANHREWAESAAWLRADTDGDGLEDGREAELGLDPTDEEPSVLVDALHLASQESPEHVENLLVAAHRSGPSPGEVTAFERRQLRLWMDAPPPYRRTIPAGGHLHADDWDKDGGPQTAPDGSPGVDDAPFEPNDRDGDGVLRWFYNADAEVYDPATDTYEGFQPAEDRVGELGDGEGDGGLGHLADPDRFDLFVEIDYMETDNHSARPSQAVIDAIVEAYAEMGIHAHLIVDERLPHRNATSIGDGLPGLHDRHLADHRRGVFVHGLYIHGTTLNGLRTGGYGQSNRSIGEFFSVDWQSERRLDAKMYIDTLHDWQIHTTIHEIGHVGGLSHPESVDGSTTVMWAATEEFTLHYTDDELDRFRATFGEMSYYRPPTAENATG